MDDRKNAVLLLSLAIFLAAAFCSWLFCRERTWPRLQAGIMSGLIGIVVTLLMWRFWPIPQIFASH